MKRDGYAWTTLKSYIESNGDGFRKVRNPASRYQYDSYNFTMDVPHYRKYSRMMKREGLKDRIVSMSVYNKVILSFGKSVIYKIINDGFIFNMPYRLGTLRLDKTINRRKKRSVKTDMETRRSWGDSYKIVWDKTLAKFPNKSLWTMDFYQNFCRGLKTSRINEGSEDPYDKGLNGYKKRVFQKRTTFKFRTPEVRIPIK